MTKPPRKSTKRTRRPPSHAEELTVRELARRTKNFRAGRASLQLDAEELARHAENVRARRARRRAAGIALVRQWENEYREARARTGIPLAPGADAAPDAYELWSFAFRVVTEPHMLADHPMAPMIYFLAKDYHVQAKARARKLPSATVARLVDRLIDGMNPTAAWRRVAAMVGKDVEAVRKDHDRLGTVKPARQKRRLRAGTKIRG